MKPLLLAGIVLIVLGVAGLGYQGISYTYTTREEVAHIGGLQVTAEKEKTQTIPMPLIAGGLALVAGIVVVVAAARKR
jgi:hypothetical protein